MEGSELLAFTQLDLPLEQFILQENYNVERFRARQILDQILQILHDSGIRFTIE